MDLVCSRVRKVSPAGLGKKKELVRPAESEKTEEIREKEVPCGSERGKRDRETREVSEGGEKMQKILIVVDMQNDFIDGALGTPEAVAIVPKVEQKIREFPGKVIFTPGYTWRAVFRDTGGKTSSGAALHQGHERLGDLSAARGAPGGGGGLIR